MKILVVDDEKRVLSVVREILQAKGFEVATATSGRAALEAVAAAPPDVILLDIMMPDMDGATVAQTLRERPPTANLPIVFLTGLVEMNDFQRGGPKIGGQLFLAKPFDADELMRVIELATAAT